MERDVSQLLERAMDVRKRLEECSLPEEAKVVELLARELVETQPPVEKPFYTTSEAASQVGVTAQTIKNWVSRGILKGYRLGGRTVIPRAELEDYRSLADAAKAIEPLPEREEMLATIRSSRRPVSWPRRSEGQ